jgi:phage-related protein
MYIGMMNATAKPVRWIGSSRKIGVALYAAQMGETDPAVKALRGFAGRGVLEVVTDLRGDTWRTVYTVRFEDAVYVLHAFQKKSKKGSSTPKHELELIRQRLAEADRDYKGRLH